MKIGLALVLGAWLAGSLMVAGVATKNFFIIDDLLKSSSTHAHFQQEVKAMGAEEAHALLWYFSSELNRFYFVVWGWVDLAFAVALLALSRCSRRRKLLIASLIIFAMTLVTTFYLTPHIVNVGRTLDFVPRVPPPPGLSRFGMFHAAYSTLDMLKLLFGVWMAIELVRAKDQSADAA